MPGLQSAVAASITVDARVMAMPTLGAVAIAGQARCARDAEPFSVKRKRALLPVVHLEAPPLASGSGAVARRPRLP